MVPRKFCSTNISRTTVYVFPVYMYCSLYVHVHVFYCDNAGIGRYKNDSYLEFLSCLNSARRWRGRFGPQEASINNKECCCTNVPIPAIIVGCTCTCMTCQFRNKFVQHWSWYMYIRIDISEIQT